MADYRWVNRSGHPIALIFLWFDHNYNSGNSSSYSIPAGHAYPPTGPLHFGAASPYARVSVRGPAKPNWDAANTYFGDGLAANGDYYIDPRLAALGVITIYVDGKYLVGEEQRIIEVCDNFTGAHSLVTITGGDQGGVPVSIRSNDIGYGSAKYRNVTNNEPWITAEFLQDGEHISP